MVDNRWKYVGLIPSEHDHAALGVPRLQVLKKINGRNLLRLTRTGWHILQQHLSDTNTVMMMVDTRQPEEEDLDIMKL